MFSLKTSVAQFFAEGIGRDAVTRVDVDAVRVGAVLSCVHAYGGIRYVQHFEVGEFVSQMAEVDGVEFALQGEVGDLVGFIFGQQFHQCTGFGYIESFLFLGVSSSPGDAEASRNKQYVS